MRPCMLQAFNELCQWKVGRSIGLGPRSHINLISRPGEKISKKLEIATHKNLALPK
ncbi:hypothetical protein Peur_020510 [Populus x canadensis]